MAIKVNVQEVARQQRKIRNPQHPFAVRSRPWAITPFFIAPVLPGETMRNLLLQSRAVSDPVKSKLVGWWKEYYFFYVKLRDLDGRDDFANMMLDPSQSLSAYNTAAATYYYHKRTTVSWVRECLKRVTEEFFRYDGETWDGFKVGDLPAAMISTNKNVWDSLTLDADRAAIADVDVDQNSDGTITVSEIDKARFQWEVLRTQGMTTVTFEDYLATFGVRPNPEEAHRPELVRFIRDWQYPANTIDPGDGSASSALSWKIVERADKDRYFKEPGFLFGVTVSRPKVYLGGQHGTMTDAMTDLYAWLPAILRDDVEASWKKLDAFAHDFGGNGSSGGNTGAVWFDLADLFMYGEQFVNFALSETDAGLVAVPTAASQRRYASGTDADALFASASPANQVREDGIVSVSIASTVMDQSQTT